ncbi:solute carrier family 2, facilitated glucose transporter member 8-like [Haemaphysalis longicornis]
MGTTDCELKALSPNQGIDVPFEKANDVLQRPPEGEYAAEQRLLAPASVRLYFAVFTAYLASLSFGAACTYSSPTLEELRLAMNFAPEDSSWFGSLLKCGSIFGGVLGGQLVNVLGRRPTLFISCAWFLAGWMCIIFAPSTLLLFAGRALTGVAVGIVTPAVPVFISEICPAHNRGLLVAASNVVVFSGMLLTYILGKWLGYKILAVTLMMPAAAMIFLLLWTKESPRWLLQKGRREAALQSALFYHGPNGKKLFTAIEESVSNTESFRIQELALPYIYKPFLYTLMAMFIQQSSACGVIVVFGNDIFEAAQTPIPASDCVIIMGAVQVLVNVVTMLLADRVGRKILLLSSTLTTSLSLMLLGYSFYLKQHHEETFLASYSWLPLAAMVLFFITLGTGLGPLPWVLLGELLPLRVKGFATGFCTAFSFGYTFLLIKEFYRLQELLGVPGTYWLFGALLVVGFVLFAVFLPETKGKTLEEIEQLFGKKLDKPTCLPLMKERRCVISP